MAAPAGSRDLALQSTITIVDQFNKVRSRVFCPPQLLVQVGTGAGSQVVLHDPGLRSEHFYIYRGSETFYVICRELTGTLAGNRRWLDHVAFDGMIQVLRFENSSLELRLVRGGRDLLAPELERIANDKSLNSCPECLSGGICPSCGGTTVSLDQQVLDEGTRFVEKPCTVCAGSGKCRFCKRLREITAAVLMLMESGELIRADALVERALIEINPESPRSTKGAVSWASVGAVGGTLAFPIIGTAIGALAGWFLDGSIDDRKLRKRLATADLLFLKACILNESGDACGSLEAMRQALVFYPEHLGVLTALEAMRA